MPESVAEMNLAIWKQVCELLGIPPERVVGLTLSYAPGNVPVADARYVLLPSTKLANEQITQAFTLAAGSAGKVEVRFGSGGGLGMCRECMLVVDTMADGLCPVCAENAAP